MRALTGALLAGLLVGCGAGAAPLDGGPGDAVGDGSGRAPCFLGDASAQPDGRVLGGPFATRVVRFTPGEGATFGHRAMPDVVLGPPQGAGDLQGGTDVVSLGAGGSIELGFDGAIVDGPGDDFIVFENPFTVPGATLRFWDELGEVSVSEDGTTWVPFPCARAARPYTQCAGWHPVYASTANGLCPTDPTVSGGDGFDLATVGVRRARFLRIVDLRTQEPTPPAAGFDLDAVAVLHPGL